MGRILSVEEEQKFWADLFGVMIRHEERARERAQKDRGGIGVYHRGTEVTEIENENIKFSSLRGRLCLCSEFPRCGHASSSYYTVS